MEEEFDRRTAAIRFTYGDAMVAMLRRRLLEQMEFCSTDGAGIWVRTRQAMAWQ